MKASHEAIVRGSVPPSWIVARLGFEYFAIVFAVGFVLGALRTMFVVPHLGARFAELLESPLMLAVVVVAARRLARGVELSDARWLAVGVIALALMLLAEFGFVLAVRGLSLGAWIAGRDPVSGGVYVASLGVFALCPWLLARARGHRHMAPRARGCARRPSP